MTSAYMFCYNPGCRLHMKISEAVAALGEIQYHELEQRGVTDIFDQPKEARKDYPTVIKRIPVYTNKRVFFVCEDCWGAYNFIKDTFWRDGDP